MKNEITVVLDVGARYGMHPSWNDYNCPLKYLMFEPDAIEAERLRTKLDQERFEIFVTALGKEEGERTFYLLKHRGLSSFLKPDLKSECFRRLKPGQAEIEKEIKLKIRTIDAVMAERGMHVDFLKVDTEGTEHDVIVGASLQLDKSILGLRSSCNFQPCFIDQKLFSETHSYLMEKSFILLNLDYRGYGYPRLGLFRKPEPIEPEDFRYGILVAADGVWIRRPEWIKNRFNDRDERDIAILKLSAFCMLNHAPDVGIDLLREYVLEDKISANVKETKLFKSMKLNIAHFLGRWRTVPDEQWERVRKIYDDIYNESLSGGSDFYPQVQLMKENLQGIQT